MKKYPYGIEMEFAKLLNKYIKAKISKIDVTKLDDLHYFNQAILQAQGVDLKKTDLEEVYKKISKWETQETRRTMIEKLKGVSKKDIELLDAIGFFPTEDLMERVDVTLNSITPVKFLKSKMMNTQKYDKYMTETFQAVRKYVEPIPVEYVKKVRGVIEKGYADGKSFKNMSEDIAKQTGYAYNRANLIARDQFGNMYANSQRVLQNEKAGFKTFVWQTVGDNRVRSAHQELDGKVFTWEEGANGSFPSQAIACRCSAEVDEDEVQTFAEEQIQVVDYEAKILETTRGTSTTQSLLDLEIKNAKSNVNDLSSLGKNNQVFYSMMEKGIKGVDEEGYKYFNGIIKTNDLQNHSWTPIKSNLEKIIKSEGAELQNRYVITNFREKGDKLAEKLLNAKHGEIIGFDEYIYGKPQIYSDPKDLFSNFEEVKDKIQIHIMTEKGTKYMPIGDDFALDKGEKFVKVASTENQVFLKVVKEKADNIGEQLIEKPVAKLKTKIVEPKAKTTIQSEKAKSAKQINENFSQGKYKNIRKDMTDHVQADEFAREEAQLFLKNFNNGNLSEDVKEAINKYTGSGYTKINAFERFSQKYSNELSSKFGDIVEIQRLMEKSGENLNLSTLDKLERRKAVSEFLNSGFKHHLQEDTVVYQGIPSDSERMMKFRAELWKTEIDTKIQATEFWSASTKPSVAKGFMSNKDPMILEILVEKKCKVLPLCSDEFTGMLDEAEILLKSNSKLRIVEKYTFNDENDVKIKIIRAILEEE